MLQLSKEILNTSWRKVITCNVNEQHIAVPATYYQIIGWGDDNTFGTHFVANLHQELIHSFFYAKSYSLYEVFRRRT